MDLRRSGKAEQDAQRFAQVIIGGVALNPQLSAKQPSTACYAGAPPRAPGSGGVTSGAATTCLGGFSGGIFLPGGGDEPGGGLIRRPCSTISLICEPSKVSNSSKAFAITSSLSRFAVSVSFAS